MFEKPALTGLTDGWVKNGVIVNDTFEYCGTPRRDILRFVESLQCTVQPDASDCQAASSGPGLHGCSLHGGATKHMQLSSSTNE